MIALQNYYSNLYPFGKIEIKNSTRDMSKRARQPPVFCVSLFNDELDRRLSAEYRPKPKATVVGIYHVERVVAKRFKGVKAQYFIKWKAYSSEEALGKRPTTCL